MDISYTRKDINEYSCELNIKIPYDSFTHSYDLMLQEYAKDLNIKGFRKGKVPTNLISDNVKEVVKYETFEKLAPMYINTAITKEGLTPIAPPQYKEIPKILEELDIPFTIVVTTMPKFKLGNMKNIKLNKEKLTVEEKEIDKMIDELKKSQKTKTVTINDNWAQEIGEIIDMKEVKTLEQLRERIKNSLQIQKEHFQEHTLRNEALKLGIKESSLEIPQVAIDFEAQEREKAFNEDMKSKGISIDEFLKANSITIDKMRELWLLDAKEAISTDVFLTLYADTKKVAVTEDELDKKIEAIKNERPDVDANIFSNTQWKEYIKNVLRKEKAFKLFTEEVFGKDTLIN